MKRLEQWKTIVFKFIKKKSIFYNTFGCLMLLSVCMFMFFSFYIESSTEARYAEDTNGMNLSFLKEVSTTVNTNIVYLQNNMTQNLWGEVVRGYMINPNIASSDDEYELIQTLSTLVEKNPILDRAFFHSPISQKVFMSDGEAVYYSRFDEKDIFEQKLTEREECRLDREIYSDMYYNGEDIYLIQEFFTGVHIGTLVYKLDALVFMEYLHWGTDEEVYVIDEDGEMLYSSYYDEAKLKLAELRTQGRLIGNVDADMGEEGDFYIYEDQSRNLSYLSKVEYGGGRWDWRMILPILLPMIGVYIILSMLASYFISKRIYQPINRLLSITSGTQAEDVQGKVKNEVDYLELMYSETVSDNKRLTELMHQVGAEVSEQLYREILVGKEFSRDELTERFDSIGHREAVRRTYIVGVVQITSRSDSPVRGISDSLFYNHLNRLVRECDFLTCSRNVLYMDHQRMALILGFAEKTTAAVIKFQTSQLKVYLQGQLSGMADPVTYCFGGIYKYVGDICFSYREAMDMVNYYRYIGEAQDDEKEAAASAEPEKVDQEHYYKSRISRALRQASNGKRKDAQTMLDESLNELGGEAENIRKRLTETVFNVIIENILEYHIDVQSLPVIASSDSEAGDGSVVYEIDQLRIFARAAIDAIENRSRKNQIRYIQDAQKYMAEHYSDSALSLNEVSEYLNITSTYFSTLFNDIMNKSFSGYLNELRIEQAKHLLQNTNINIKDIGFKCGFSSVQNFNRVFKKYMSLTPGQYREMNRNQ